MFEASLTLFIVGSKAFNKRKGPSVVSTWEIPWRSQKQTENQQLWNNMDVSFWGWGSLSMSTNTWWGGGKGDWTRLFSGAQWNGGKQWALNDMQKTLLKCRKMFFTVYFSFFVRIFLMWERELRERMRYSFHQKHWNKKKTVRWHLHGKRNSPEVLSNILYFNRVRCSGGVFN